MDEDTEIEKSVVRDLSSEPRQGLMGQLRGDAAPRTAYIQLTAASWIIAAGAYGYISGMYGQEYPEFGWVFFVLGLGVGAGMAGLVALMDGGDDDGD